MGMEMAGHVCAGHCEIDKFANKSYIAMHNPKEEEWYADDIRGVNPGELPEADVYCFGFPCQAFSIAGKRRGFEDTRGTLFFEVMRLAKERKPKILFAFYYGETKVGKQLQVVCGCFSGSLDDFEKAVKEKHKNNIYAKRYKKEIKKVKMLWKL